MESQNIEKLLQEIESFQKGHFLLHGGYHISERFVSKACLKNPKILNIIYKLMFELLSKESKLKVDKMLGISSCGLLLGSNVSSILINYDNNVEKNISFALARVDTKSSVFLEHGSELYEKENVCIIVDGVTTGFHVRSLADLVLAHKANLEAICCLVDSRINKEEIYMGKKILSVIKKQPEIYLAEYCELCKSSIPLTL